MISKTPLNQDFVCNNCHQHITLKDSATQNRNHCPFCLFSKHVDENVSGDRHSLCKGLMQPIGLTFKKTKPDKYGRERVGELMIVHHCTKCGKLSINRIAADDTSNEILHLLEDAALLTPLKETIVSQGIRLIGKESLIEVKRQLFGSNLTSFPRRRESNRY